MSSLLVFLFKFFFSPSMDSLAEWGKIREPILQGGDTEAHTPNILSKVTPSGVSKAGNRIQALSSQTQAFFYPSYCLINKNGTGPEWYMASGIEFSSLTVMTIVLEPKAGARWQIWVSLGRPCRIFDTGIPPPPKKKKTWDIHSCCKSTRKNYTFPTYLKGLV